MTGDRIGTHGERRSGSAPTPHRSSGSRTRSHTTSRGERKMPMVNSTELARHAEMPLEDLLLAVDLGLLRGAVQLHGGGPPPHPPRAAGAVRRARAPAPRVRAGGAASAHPRAAVSQ